MLGLCRRLCKQQHVRQQQRRAMRAASSDQAAPSVRQQLAQQHGQQPDEPPPLALLYNGWANKDTYVQLLAERGVSVVEADALRAADDWRRVVFAAVWNVPQGLLHKCPRLRCVMSMGAGVDSLLAPGQVPDGLPIARIVDPLMASRMATWVTWGVINWQRRMDAYAAAQARRCWDLSIEERSNLDNADVAVGVMGLGVMGMATARALLGLGYRVSGWSRTPAADAAAQQARAGVVCYHGVEQLRQFVAAQDVVVCLLPLTPETTGIINAELLSWMRPGSALINGGRGRHVVEADLLHALDSGQLGCALLDVFATEPLPAESPLWAHPRVRITPHVASMTTLATAADQIAATFHRVAAGEAPDPEHLVDRSRGY